MKKTSLIIAVLLSLILNPILAGAVFAQEPDAIAADCPVYPITKPCVWGIVFDGYGWRVWMQHPGRELFRQDGFVVLYGQGGAVRTYSVRARYYTSVNDITWYATGHVEGCGQWSVGMGYFGAWQADIRLPNSYVWYCIYLAKIQA